MRPSSKNWPARLAAGSLLVCGSSYLFVRALFALAAPPRALEAATWLADVGYGKLDRNPCSGVRLDARTVATAAHCTEPPRMFVRTRATEGYVPARVDAFFPELDLALLQRAEDASAAPFPSAQARFAELQLGLGARLWSVSRAGLHEAKLIAVDDRFLTVKTMAPLCYGDSGSPIVMVTPVATVALGVLATGHPQCKVGAPARFARIDGDRRPRLLVSRAADALRSSQ